MSDESARYRPDRGGVFDSDVHRRVLGHLSLPSDDFGWSAEALTARMAEDSDTPDEQPEVEAVLKELIDDDLAHEPIDGVFQQTKEGLEKLTGPIADEPEPGSPVKGPARLDVPTPLTARAKTSHQSSIGKK